LTEAFPTTRSAIVTQLQDQQKELSKLFYVLDQTLTAYSRGRVMYYPATGTKWDIYRSAIGNDTAVVKGPSLENAVLELEGIIALVQEGPEQVEVAPASGHVTKAKNIFISHGTPTDALQKLERFIRALGLNPLIVKDEPSKGGAVDDVVSGYMNECTCAVILATKDDQVAGRFQPRPNVLAGGPQIFSLLAFSLNASQRRGCTAVEFTLERSNGGAPPLVL
jgi:hypothetical protein